jgi:hypothetical protein
MSYGLYGLPLNVLAVSKPQPPRMFLLCVLCIRTPIRILDMQPLRTLYTDAAEVSLSGMRYCAEAFGTPHGTTISYL